MTTYARIVAAQAVDVTTSDPHQLFHPEIAAEFVTVPDGVADGSILVNSVWTPPISVPENVGIVLPLLSTSAFYLAFTVDEMIAIKASSDLRVKEFFARYQILEAAGAMIDPNLSSWQNELVYLATASNPGPGAGVLASADRIQQILAGTPQ